MSVVLIVEDNSDLRVIMTLALESEGYQVELAENGAVALEVLNKISPPSLILLDLMMPVMNGWEFLAQQKDLPHISHIPVIICSAVKPDNLSCLGFLKKPVDLSDLIEAVEGVCQA